MGGTIDRSLRLSQSTVEVIDPGVIVFVKRDREIFTSTIT
jgi:hypothetical protein